MAISSASSAASSSRSSERRRKAREVVAELLRQQLEGSAERPEQVFERHPELLPELTAEWRKAQRIQSAMLQAEVERYDSALRRLHEDCEIDASDMSHVELSEDLPARIGRYEIEKLIGLGGFGRVYLGWDDQLNRHVAIKTPHSHRLSDPEAVATYLAEARVLAKLDHPAIVPVFDVGRTEEGSFYIVSKWIQGIDLASRMRRSRLSMDESVRIALEAASALHYAHAQGIVHRDIKPANILLDRQERACLADFGLAVRDNEVTEEQLCAGTPSYMSPEQARGESHRVDGRSDLFSLGVVLYESLTGNRPFSGDSPDKLLEQIVSAEPRSLREWDDRIPVELERICLKLLAKRAADRYATAKDLLVDLRYFARGEPSVTVTMPARLNLTSQRDVPPTGNPEAGARPARIIPKGLRSFDASDAAFFLELLPGPRDRQGVPESLRQWKSRIEEMDQDESFGIGLMYGPSGCGKSSLVRAGLLPLLASHVESVYVEAGPDETESQLLKRLQKKIPDLPVESGLAKCLAAIRRGYGIQSGHKLFIVIDQFEQWLSGRSEEERRTLVEALRQCDGSRLQCLILVRDDFWLAVSRFMAELEVELIQGRNTSLVDLFDPLHARKVLIEFGRAYDRLPNALQDFLPEQQQFLDEAVDGLIEEGKVIPVRLALFAEMVKSRPWNRETLRSIGGSQGVGITFLEETFSARTANPRSRYHERAARMVLEALLPRRGSPIKGHIRSYPDLLDLSGYGKKPREFKELMRILDAETRLLTPADLVQEVPAGPSFQPIRYYQLTHDYLVPSLREWLTQRQKASASGRAELRLSERSAMWSTTKEGRQLPSMWEWLTIRLFTNSKAWSESQRKMMRVAARRHTLVLTGLLAGSLLLLLAGAELTTSAKNLLLNIRGKTAPVWLAFGQEEAIFPLLQASPDPTLRTRLIHDLSPLLISPERLVTRAGESLDPSLRRALLLCAGEMVGQPQQGSEANLDIQRRSVSESILRQLTELYQIDPDPGVHSAAEWSLRRFLPDIEWNRIEQQLKHVAPQGDRQWFLTTEGHTLVVIPGPARFRMGSMVGSIADAKYGGETLIRRSFSIATKETTAEQFQRFLAANPTVAPHPPTSNRHSLTAPQVQVTWYQAAAYCNWLSAREGIAGDQWCFLPNARGEYAAGMSVAPNWLHRSGYRLPTEAEWEYACRAGTDTPWYFGHESAFLPKYAQTSLTDHPEPPFVGLLKPNDFGLFDTLGNAAEWCLEPYLADEMVPQSMSSDMRAHPINDSPPRIVRGGSLTNNVSHVTSSDRAGMLPNQPATSVGFRVARSYP